MDPVSALLSGGLSMAGGLLNNVFSGYRQDQANQFNQQQIAQQEQFQETMSNTAYQRATADMKAAGLNPILAYARGGASAPTGGAATATAAPVSDVMGPAMNSALATARLDSDLKTAESTRDLQQEQARNQAQQRGVMNTEISKNLATADNIRQDTVNKGLQPILQGADIERAKIDRDALMAPAMRVMRQIGTDSVESARAAALPSSALGVAKDFIGLGVKAAGSAAGKAASFADRFQYRGPNAMDPANVYTDVRGGQ